MVRTTSRKTQLPVLIATVFPVCLCTSARGHTLDLDKPPAEVRTNVKHETEPALALKAERTFPLVSAWVHPGAAMHLSCCQHFTQVPGYLRQTNAEQIEL